MSKVSKVFKRDPNVTPILYCVPEILPGEEFKLITDQAAPNILPYYAISNFGRIWNIYENHFMRTSWDGPGYRIAVLRHKDGMAHTLRVHRLVMLTHRYIPGCEDLWVNHINGNKQQNYINCYNPNTGIVEDNLEWCTPSENEIHAFQTGLKRYTPKGQSMYNKYTEEQAHEVCRLLEIGNLSHSEIGEVTGTNKGFVENIKYGRNWKDVASNYNFKFNEQKKVDRSVVRNYQIGGSQI